MNDLSITSKTSCATSHAGYIFDPLDFKWQISRDNLIYLSWIKDFLHPKLHDSYRKLLRHYAEIYSAGHTDNLNGRFREFIKAIYKNRGLVDKITSNDLINYRAILSPEHMWYLGAVRVFLKSWIEFDHPGIDEDVSNLLDNWKISGNIKGKAVQTLCPKKGPLSDFEFEALYQALIHAFECGTISLDDFVLAKLFLATGRRPAQLGDLKAKDIIEAKSENGLQEFIINVPRRKQHGIGWREQFKPFALTSEIGITLKSLIAQNYEKFTSEIGNIHENLKNEIPIFPNWKIIKEEFYKTNLENVYDLLRTQKCHIPTNDFRIELDKIVLSLNIPSERTGKKLRVFPTRLRRTIATRAAREGYGELIIAELLDHTDTQNVRIYTENIPEHVNAINEAMARQLAPLAQAFSGMLVDRERDATRGNDLSSRIKSQNGSVGTCSHHGFCGALAPIACYTCRQFQPWLDGPHQEMLNALISERIRIIEVTQDPLMASINDRTILAITQVVLQCEARRTQIEKEMTYG